MKLEENLRNCLTDLQKECVGFYYNRHTKQVECVVENSEYTFKTITVTPMLGSNVNYYTKDVDHVVKVFPNNYSLYTMIDTLSYFSKWYNENFSN